MATFVSDPFSGTTGVTLQTTTAPTGGTWAKHTTSSTDAVITAAKRVRPNLANTKAIYYSPGTPASSAYSVQADFVPIGAFSAVLAGICGRIDTTAETFYYARYSQGSTRWELYKAIAGTYTLLTNSASQTLTASTTYVVKLLITDALKSLYVDGALVCSTTDNAITATGKAGFRLVDGNSTDAAGLHIDNFAAADIVSTTTVIGQGTATAAGTAVASIASVSRQVDQGTATASGSTVTSTSATNDLTRQIGQGTAVAAGSTVSGAVSNVPVTRAVGTGSAAAAGSTVFGVVDDAEHRLALPPSFEDGFGQASSLYDQVAVNTHFIYIDTPYGDYNQVIQHLADLGIRHIREGIIASWFDARSGSLRAAILAVHARNQALPASEQPIFVNGGTTDFPPNQPHPFTIADWMATMDGGHQHYNNDSNSGIPGAIPGVGGPLPDATFPWATPEIPWAVFSSIQSSNEPQGDVSQIPEWQHQLRLQKSARSQVVYEGLPYVTQNGLQSDTATTSKLPVIGSVAMTNGSWDTWGDMSRGTNVVDAGDLHVYMGGSNPSFEHVSNEIFNARSYNGRLKAPLEAHFPTESLPFVMTETGYINSGNDSAHFPIPNDVVAVYLLNTLLINAKLGIRRTFIYELLDEANLPTVSERNFGLIRFDGVWKNQAYALRNYLALTEFSQAAPADQQAIDYDITGFTPGPQNFQTHQIDGSQYDQNPDRLDHLLVQQDAFRYMLWVWRQKNLYNREEGTYADVDTQTLTLELGALDVASVSLASPTAGGAATPDDGRVFTPLAYAGGSVNFDIAGAPVAIAITVRPPAQTSGMSSFVLNRSDVFPVGTSVGLYTQLNPATQQPLGPLNQSSTVGSDGTVTFISLNDGVTYYAYAVVNSEPRHVSFQTTATVAGGGGGLDEEIDPLSIKLVPSAGQSIVPSADVPALTLKSYSGAASNATVFEARDAAASDALRARVTKEGTIRSHQTNAFFPNFEAYGNSTDSQPQARINGPKLELGPGGSTAPDLSISRTTNGAGKGQLLYRGAPLPSGSAVNIRDYGAIADGSTDAVTAFQAAVDDLAAGGGGTIKAVGAFMIGTPGIIWPTNSTKAITIEGVATGGTNPLAQPTRLTRNGTHAIITADGTGTGGGQQCQGLTLKDITIDGNAQAGTLIHAARCAALRWSGVRLKNCPNTGLFAPQLWNAHFTDCLFETCGTYASSFPAVLLTDVSGGASNTNTVQFANCHWEANTGTDLQIGGSVPATGVVVTGSKFERSTGHAVQIDNGQAVVIQGAYVYAESTPSMVQYNGGSNNSFIGCNFVSTSAAYYMQFSGGSRVAVTGCGFGSIAGYQIRLDSGFGDISITGNTFLAGGTGNIDDQRTSKTGLITQNGQLRAYDGVATKTKAGVPADGDFLRTPVDGTLAVDTTNNKLYCRIGGTWKGVTVA